MDPLDDCEDLMRTCQDVLSTVRGPWKSPYMLRTSEVSSNTVAVKMLRDAVLEIGIVLAVAGSPT